jgi:hypothetical protein
MGMRTLGCESLLYTTLYRPLPRNIKVILTSIRLKSCSTVNSHRKVDEILQFILLIHIRFYIKLNLNNKLFCFVLIRVKKPGGGFKLLGTLHEIENGPVKGIVYAE